MVKHSSFLLMHFPLCNVDFLSWKSRIYRRAWKENLHEHHTKRIGIKLLSELLPSEILEIKVSKIAFHSSTHMCLV